MRDLRKNVVLSSFHGVEKKKDLFDDPLNRSSE
jgi:hypothetical protein